MQHSRSVPTSSAGMVQTCFYQPILTCHDCPQVHSTERQAQDLILDLRELPSKDALALRAQVIQPEHDKNAAALRRNRTNYHNDVQDLVMDADRCDASLTELGSRSLLDPLLRDWDNTVMCWMVVYRRRRTLQPPGSSGRASSARCTASPRRACTEASDSRGGSADQPGRACTQIAPSAIVAGALPHGVHSHCGEHAAGAEGETAADSSKLQRSVQRHCPTMLKTACPETGHAVM